jgi:hypothetical protein
MCPYSRAHCHKNDNGQKLVHREVKIIAIKNINIKWPMETKKIAG